MVGQGAALVDQSVLIHRPSAAPLSTPIPPHPLQMKEGWKAKEQLADRVCALFRQRVLKPVT